MNEEQHQMKGENVKKIHINLRVILVIVNIEYLPLRIAPNLGFSSHHCA